MLSSFLIRVDYFLILIKGRTIFLNDFCLGWSYFSIVFELGRNYFFYSFLIRGELFSINFGLGWEYLLINV